MRRRRRWWIARSARAARSSGFACRTRSTCCARVAGRRRCRMRRTPSARRRGPAVAAARQPRRLIPGATMRCRCTAVGGRARRQAEQGAGDRATRRHEGDGADRQRLVRGAVRGGAGPRRRRCRSCARRGITVSYLSSGGWLYGITRGMDHKNVELPVAVRGRGRRGALPRARAPVRDREDQELPHDGPAQRGRAAAVRDPAPARAGRYRPACREHCLALGVEGTAARLLRGIWLDVAPVRRRKRRGGGDDSGVGDGDSGMGDSGGGGAMVAAAAARSSGHSTSRAATAGRRGSG